VPLARGARLHRPVGCKSLQRADGLAAVPVAQNGQLRGAAGQTGANRGRVRPGAHPVLRAITAEMHANQAPPFAAALVRAQHGVRAHFPRATAAASRSRGGDRTNPLSRRRSAIHQSGVARHVYRQEPQPADDGPGTGPHHCRITGNSVPEPTASSILAGKDVGMRSATGQGDVLDFAK
jgi:hypothetical protein